MNLRSTAHWDDVTLFLDRPKSSLDNNTNKQALRHTVCRNFRGAEAPGPRSWLHGPIFSLLPGHSTDATSTWHSPTLPETACGPARARLPTPFLPGFPGPWVPTGKPNCKPNICKMPTRDDSNDLSLFKANHPSAHFLQNLQRMGRHHQDRSLTDKGL